LSSCAQRMGRKRSIVAIVCQPPARRRLVRARSVRKHRAMPAVMLFSSSLWFASFSSSIGFSDLLFACGHLIPQANAVQQSPGRVNLYCQSLTCGFPWQLHCTVCYAGRIGRANSAPCRCWRLLRSLLGNFSPSISRRSSALRVLQQC
jgi:hypothetical protein